MLDRQYGLNNTDLFKVFIFYFERYKKLLEGLYKRVIELDIFLKDYFVVWENKLMCLEGGEGFNKWLL